MCTRAVANCCRCPQTHAPLVAAGALLWAGTLLANDKAAPAADVQASLCTILAELTTQREHAHKALESGRLFQSLTAALRRSPEHAELAESVAQAVRNLLCDNIAMRALTVEAELADALIRAFELHSGSGDGRVSLAVVQALVSSLC